jgi:putative alpha-1,2-mannosidase
MFSRPFGSYQTWRNHSLQHDTVFKGTRLALCRHNRHVLAHKSRYVWALLYQRRQARRNLFLDADGKDFAAVKAATRARWDDVLSKVSTAGGTERRRTIFYTALWQSLCRMTDISEDGRYNSGFDHAYHNTDGHDFYVDDGLWDTFRTVHPLQLLLDGHRQEDLVRSYLRMYQQSGWIPSFPSAAGSRPS